MIEYQILGVMTKMMVYATTCKVNNNDNKSIASKIVSGFIGSLRGWWNNFLTTAQRLKILNFVKTKN